MKGIRLYGKAFADCFAPIMAELDRCSVYVAEFGYPPSWLLLTKKNAMREQAVWDVELRAMSLDAEPQFFDGLYRPGFLGRFGAGVRADWNDLLLFRVPPDRSVIARDLHRVPADSEEGARFTRERIGRLGPEFLIQNWDAAFWQIFTNDEPVLEKLQRAMEVAGLRTEAVDFEQDSPDPVEIARARMLGDRRHGRTR